jgi:hypothetical protein
MARRLAAVLAVALIASTGCVSAAVQPNTSPPRPSPPSASASTRATAPPATPTEIASAVPLPSPSEAAQGPALASGDALPACSPAKPAASATVTFVANGAAWAISRTGGDLVCLFAIHGPATLDWGPLGDRALLPGLEVKGVAGGPPVSLSGETPSVATWTRPTGAAIVYTTADGSRLEKARVNGSPIQDVTPMAHATFLSVVYHPSGDAFAYAVRQGNGEEEIWISTNKGKTPQRLVFSEEGTRFGAIGFDLDGRHLLYAAQHANNHAELHQIDVTNPSSAPVMWSGPVGSTIADIQPGLISGSFAFTTEAVPCLDSTAMAVTPSGAFPLLPDANAPTRAVGWLDATTVLVSAGRCDGPLQLSAVDTSSFTIVPIASGVTAAAVRTPVPTPPAPLPAPVAKLGRGFA